MSNEVIYLYRRKGQPAWATCEAERYFELSSKQHLFEVKAARNDSDYAALEAECERLRAENINTPVAMLEAHNAYLRQFEAGVAALRSERDALRAQLEAIRAAGGEAKVVAWMLADAVGGSMLEFQRELLLQDQCRHGGELVPLCDQRIVAAMAAELEQARRTAEYWKQEHLAGNAVIEQLRAELEAARKQGPVAWTWQGTLDRLAHPLIDMPDGVAVFKHRSPGATIPLYALPPLAGQVAAPETWRDQLLREYPNSDPDYWTEELIINAQSREIAEWRSLLATPSMEGDV